MTLSPNSSNVNRVVRAVAIGMTGVTALIAAENAPHGETENREQSRARLLGEVAQGWQRPVVFSEPVVESAGDVRDKPLEKKLDRILLPTVNFTNVPLARAVSTLSAASEEFDGAGPAPRGLNIVLVDPAGKAPTVSITLRNLSLRRVLDLMLDSVGYQYEVQADAVVVRPGGENTSLDTTYFAVSRSTFIRMTGVGGADPNAKSKTAPAVENLNVNESGALKSFLQQAGVNFDSVAGGSLAYDGSGMFVTQTARNLDRIRKILNRYNDVRQVEIEAKFMEVQEGALEELGVKWTLRNGPGEVYSTDRVNRSLNDAFSNGGNARTLSVISPQVSSTTTSDGAKAGTTTENMAGVNLSIPVSPPTLPGGVLLGAANAAIADLTGTVGQFDVNAVVRALSQKQGTDLLSAPKVTVLSGNPANIIVAQEMRYPQSYGEIQSQVGTGNASGGGSAGVSITAGTPQEFATRNVGVELRVTPTVEEDDYSISLDLNPKVTEFDGFVEYGGPSIAISGGTTVTVPPGFYQPIFSVREVSTKVTLWDGATLIMGGLTREEVKKVNDKVPILGDIPLLGRLFRSKGESSQKRNLLIFVTANLVNPGGAPKKQNVGAAKPNSAFQNPTLVTPEKAEARDKTRK
jgi:general secretion pathway protein D